MAEGNKRISLYELLKKIKNPLKQRCVWHYIINDDKDLKNQRPENIGAEDEHKCTNCSGYKVPWLNWINKCPAYYPLKKYFPNKK